MSYDFSNQLPNPSLEIPSIAPSKRGIAPIWHTLLLVIAIGSVSFLGSGRLESKSLVNDPQRLLHYGLSAAMELVLVAFVYLGLRLRKVPFATLFGKLPRGLNDITKEAGIALLFWIFSMCVLASFALTWNSVQTAIYRYHQTQSPANGAHRQSEESPQQQQIEMAKKLMLLAPANAAEIAAWAALCILVGFSEETIFRGYLQQQGTSLFRSIVVGVVLSSVIFGAAHGYQGLRGMCLITVYGALFSLIALLRRNLLPGMLAHTWHDFATGMLLAFIRATNLLDHLPKSS
jgi:membrane protease YdiL (CAAX protease family)